MSNRMGFCITCAKFKTDDCPKGVMVPGGDFDGKDGGCSFWIGEICMSCVNLADSKETGRTHYQCKLGSAHSRFDIHTRKCSDYAHCMKPTKAQPQTTLSMWS